MMPNLILGLLAIVSKYVYMVVPIYETKQCYLYYDLDESFCYIIEVNMAIFFIMNWLQTLILVILLFQIRNVKDELNLKKELTIIILIWLLFSLSYFFAL